MGAVNGGGGATLSSFFQAAGIRRPPAWSESVAMPYPPLPHQIRSLNQALRNSRYKDLSQAGTGKSLSALALLLARASDGNKCLYVTQPGLVGQARDALAEWFPGHPFKVGTFAGDVKKREKLCSTWNIEGWPDILFLPYSFFVGWVDGRHKKRVPSEIERFNWHNLLDTGYSMLALDEAKAAKNTSSQLHKAVACFAGPDDGRTNGLLLMEGTPVENRTVDAFGLIHLAEPGRYRSEKAFEDKHIIWSWWEDRKTIADYANIDYLNESLFRRAHRFLKKDIMELPPVTVEDVPVDLTARHKALYRKVVDEQMLLLEDGTMLDFTVAQRLYQATQRMLVCPEAVTETEIGQNALLTTLDTVLDSVGLKERKVVVGCWYRGTIAKLMKVYEKHNPAFINGDSDTGYNKKKFVEDDTCRIVFTNYRSGGIGIDGFQKVCSYAVMLEVPTVPGHFEQWVSRLDRSGQTEPVTVYLLYPRGTVAATLRRKLIEKQEAVEGVVRDKGVLLRELLGG